MLNTSTQPTQIVATYIGRSNIQTSQSNEVFYVKLKFRLPTNKIGYVILGEKTPPFFWKEAIESISLKFLLEDELSLYQIVFHLNNCKGNKVVLSCETMIYNDRTINSYHIIRAA